LEALAMRARERDVPIIALKSGTSALGEQANLSHTNSFGSLDVLVDALFARLGIGRAPDLPTFVETLKLLHVHGPLNAPTLTSASCSGGEAALLADAAEAAGVDMPELPGATARGLRETLGPRVHVRNPLDYQTFIWGDEEAQQRCFAHLLPAGSDLHALAVDVPRHDRADPEIWRGTLRAFIAAHAQRPAPAAVITSLPEGLPDEHAIELIGHGIAPCTASGRPWPPSASQRASPPPVPHPRCPCFRSTRPMPPSPRRPGIRGDMLRPTRTARSGCSPNPGCRFPPAESSTVRSTPLTRPPPSASRSLRRSSSWSWLTNPTTAAYAWA